MFGDKCLDADNQGTANGTRVIIWPCNGGPTSSGRSAPTVRSANVQAGLCLDVERPATANGTHAILWTCNGSRTSGGPAPEPPVAPCGVPFDAVNARAAPWLGRSALPAARVC